ncbi:AgmX/PglI C-terminal domain-containing protein [Sorangium sp. So ce887]|uniref:AgmX/PglI C-terminal domain-containing protein n=1 Tax=Sorangium sp. So ce887 TaxID=3133324 RepID=UPI003F608166
MRSALLVLVGVHALLGCGAASRREPAADADPAHVRSAALHGSLGETRAALPSPEEAPLRASEEKERAALRLPGSERARDSAPDAPKERAPIPLSDKGRTPVPSADKERAPVRSAGKERTPIRSADKERTPVRSADKGRAARSLEADCKALGPEVQKASRMVEVLRQSDLSTPPDVLQRIADRLGLWARTAAVQASDPKLAQAATELRESFARTGAAVRKFRASLVARDRKKAGVSRAGLERELDQDAKVVRSIVGRCKSNPYDPIKGKAHIPPQVVRRVVQENFGAMRACYEKGLRQNPKLQGRIPVHLAVDGQGKVTYAGDADHPPADAPLLIALPSPGASAPSSTAPPLRDPKVVGCVLDVFRGLRFPSPADRKGVATVVYPVVFGVDDNRPSATSAR